MDSEWASAANIDELPATGSRLFGARPGFFFLGGTQFLAFTSRMVFPMAEAHDRVVKEYGAVEGSKQTLQRLAEHLAST
ncbi:MAG TPA: hypothetical protein VGM76_12210 [Lacipirellulaceae bacterium]|jgi:hypothetical protein